MPVRGVRASVSTAAPSTQVGAGARGRPRLSRRKLVDAFRNSPDHGSTGIYPDLPWAPKSSRGKDSDAYIESTDPMCFKPSFLRAVAGTTWRWSSAFCRLLPNDFKLRSLYG